MVEHGYCHCGCNGNTTIHRGTPRKYIKGHNNIAKDNSAWRGGNPKCGRGYRYVYAPEHPHAYQGRYVFAHRLAAEAKLGRYLRSDEIVTFRDSNRTNLADDNLDIITRAELMRRNRAK